MAMLRLTVHMHAHTIPNHKHLTDPMTFEEEYARGGKNAIWPSSSLF